jgi:AraC-like DNA-binding protein
VIAELDRGKNLATLPVAEAVTGDADSASGPTALLMERVCRYIDQNYAKNIKLDEMCEMAGFSKYYFTRIFKQHKNMSLIDYITFRRVERTKELLRDPMISIKEISALVGFNEPNYLTAVFKNREGLSPTEYRRKQCR